MKGNLNIIYLDNGLLHSETPFSVIKMWVILVIEIFFNTKTMIDVHNIHLIIHRKYSNSKFLKAIKLSFVNTEITSKEYLLN